MEESFFSRVYEVVCRIPAGKVATYGQVALMAGKLHGARVVGFALHQNPRPGVIPCHRVVFRDGRLSPSFAFGGEGAQRELLETEGVLFLADGAVDLSKCRWDGSD